MPDDDRPSLPERHTVTIRVARPADLDALLGLESECFASDRLSRRSLSTLIRSPSASVLVATRAARVVGYALVLARRGSRSARLYSIAVAPAEAGRGTGRRLLAAAERAARARGLSRMRLEVRFDNPAAIGLYERSGYRRTGERAGYYEDGAAALLLARSLSPSTSQAARGGLGPTLRFGRRLRRAA